MKILSSWLRSYVPALAAGDRELAQALTLRGIAVEGIFELGPGQGSLFEMDITTNRVDAMNHYGIAREAAAIGGHPLAPLHTALPASVTAARPFPVSVEEPGLCGRFTARVLKGVCIRPSSGAVAERFAHLEQKLISNAVDATNYVLLAMGQPSHAFDLDKLEGGIVVRRARKGEKLKTLDGIERTLDSEDLIVADEKKPLALAGVMGGWETMITATTQNVLVEAAWFDPGSIRRTGKRHGLHTDASHRFERGADFNGPPVASAMVSRLILADGGALEGELVDVVSPDAVARTAERPRIVLRNREVRRILGATQDGLGVEAPVTEGILTSLGCSLANQADESYAVALPSWRLDLEREIDLIEEVARAYGYNRFANTLPAFSTIAAGLPHAAKEETVRRGLLAMGWNEAISSTFCSPADAEAFAAQPGLSIPLGNPLNEEAGMLRPSLVPGMLSMLASNLNRNIGDVQLFELGTVFSGHSDRVDERMSLSLGATGSITGGPHIPAHAFDFYDLKGAIEELLSRFSTRSVYFDSFPEEVRIAPAWLHPGRSARAVADGLTVAWLGQLHAKAAQPLKLRQSVYIAEVYVDRLLQLPLRHPVAQEISRFQPVYRDFSFVFPNSARWEQIAEALGRLHIAELVSFAPREIYRGRAGKNAGTDAVPAGHFSVLIGAAFQSLDRTLRDEETQSYCHAIVAALAALGGKQRA